MPRYYCDYCDAYLTHDSVGVAAFCVTCYMNLFSGKYRFHIASNEV
jgi:hypothetical protein